jgi:hypothetical protein
MWGRGVVRLLHSISTCVPFVGNYLSIRSSKYIGHKDLRPPLFLNLVAKKRRTMATSHSSYAARMVASKKAESLMAPLLDAISEDGSTESESTVNTKESKLETVKLTPMQKLKSFAGKWVYSHCIISESKHSTPLTLSALSSPPSTYLFICWSCSVSGGDDNCTGNDSIRNGRGVHWTVSQNNRISS